MTKERRPRASPSSRVRPGDCRRASGTPARAAGQLIRSRSFSRAHGGCCEPWRAALCGATSRMARASTPRRPSPRNPSQHGCCRVGRLGRPRSGKPDLGAAGPFSALGASTCSTVARPRSSQVSCRSSENGSSRATLHSSNGLWTQISTRSSSAAGRRSMLCAMRRRVPEERQAPAAFRPHGIHVEGGRRAARRGRSGSRRGARRGGRLPISPALPAREARRARLRPPKHTGRSSPTLRSALPIVRPRPRATPWATFPLRDRGRS